MAKTDHQFEYQAFVFDQRQDSMVRLALFFAPVGEVCSWAEVGELAPDSDGPQRPRKDARVEAIRKFFRADSRNVIPTAAILAFYEGGASFAGTPGGTIGTLSVKREGFPVAAIVDGQHRLFGMKEFDPAANIAVVALLDATPVERAFHFLVVNNKASRVPATHTKALIARMRSTDLADRLKGARVAFDVRGVADVDLLNSDPDSPFFETINWTTTPEERRLVPATAIELSLAYLEGLKLPELDDRDTRRSVFVAMWKVIRGAWSSHWVEGSRLVSKVGIVCMTRLVSDLIVRWADNDELKIVVSDLDEIDAQTRKIVAKMDERFWATPWADRAQGGFDTNQGRERVYDALEQLFRNGRRGVPWYTDIEIVERAGSDLGAGLAVRRQGSPRGAARGTARGWSVVLQAQTSGTKAPGTLSSSSVAVSTRPRPSPSLGATASRRTR